MLLEEFWKVFILLGVFFKVLVIENVLNNWGDILGKL